MTTAFTAPIFNKPCTCSTT